MSDSFIIRITFFLLFLFLLIMGLYYLRDILIPVLFAALLSMLLLPVSRKVERWTGSRIFSIIVSLLLVLSIIAAIILLSYSQINNFTENLELVKQKLVQKLNIVQDYIELKTGVSSKEQMVWLEERYTALMESSASTIKSILMGFTQGIVYLGLVLIYIFFFLLYRERFKTFMLKLFSEVHHVKVTDILNRTQDLILHYLTGLLIALTILGTMNTIGLLALGIPQAIFLGYLGGFLNIIPYVGTLIGSLLPILMALLFKDSIWSAVGVLAVYLFNQFIDNHITTPNVVGSHVQVNPLSTIVAVFTGGLLWGIPGMILFIPLVGVFKIICDNVERLQPFGYLLGEDTRVTKTPGLIKKIGWLFRRKK